MDVSEKTPFLTSWLSLKIPCESVILCTDFQLMILLLCVHLRIESDAISWSTYQLIKYKQYSY